MRELATSVFSLQSLVCVCGLPPRSRSTKGCAGCHPDPVVLKVAPASCLAVRRKRSQDRQLPRRQTQTYYLQTSAGRAGEVQRACRTAGRMTGSAERLVYPGHWTLGHPDPVVWDVITAISRSQNGHFEQSETILCDLHGDSFGIPRGVQMDVPRLAGGR